MKKLFFFFTLLLFFQNVFAANGPYDVILQMYSDMTSVWAVKLLPLVRYIFWSLATIELLHQIGLKKIFTTDFSKLGSFLMIRYISIALFSYIFLDIHFYTSIIDWFSNIGADLGGVKLLSNNGNIHYSVSTLFDILWNNYSTIVYSLLGAVGVSSIFSTAIANFLLLIAAIILICIIITCIVVEITIIEAYIVLFGGFILVGFAGSSWTLNYWQKYLSYVGGLALRLFLTSAIIGLIISQFDNPTINAAISVTSITSISSIIVPLIVMLAVLALNLAILLTIPSKASSLLNGQVNASLGELVGAAGFALSGGNMISSLARGGGSAAGSVAKQAIQSSIGSSGGGISKGRGAVGGATSDGNTNTGGGWKDALSTAGTQAKSGVGEAKNHFANMANKSNSISGSSSGTPPVNMNPHSGN